MYVYMRVYKYQNIDIKISILYVPMNILYLKQRIGREVQEKLRKNHNSRKHTKSYTEFKLKIN